MISAAAAVAAQQQQQQQQMQHHAVNNIDAVNGRISNSTGPLMGSGGGSILTGFSIRSTSNPAQQHSSSSNY